MPATDTGWKTKRPTNEPGRRVDLPPMKEGKILTEVSRLLHGIAAVTLLLFADYCVPAAAAPARASNVSGNSTLTKSPVLIPVSADPARGALQSGRIIVFAKKLNDPMKPDRQVNFNDFTPSATSIAAREVNDVRAGTVVLIDAETDGFPAPFSTLEPGTYEVQAVLDRNHDYAYSGRGAGDLVSKVVTVTLPGPIPELNLDTEIRARDEMEAAADNVPGGISNGDPGMAPQAQVGRFSERRNDRVSRFAQLHPWLGRLAARL